MGGFLSHLTPEQNSQILEATCGPIRGNVYKHKEDVVDGYLGIPFAKPPVGELRFQKPVASEKWTETRDCYNYGPACVQTGGFGEIAPPRSVTPEEANCLTLNVFVSRTPSTEFISGKPVMIYIHGGGFELASSSDYDAYSLSGTLPLRDIVVVSINYRLGVFGFLTTGDEVCRGNLGLWDQTLALKWVQNHISSFGGDPKNVTVFGQSAGGASTDLLSLSPHSRDLFHKFIPMSGSSHCDFAIRTSENEAKIFREFAEFHGFKGGDSNDLFNWYQGQPSDVLSNVKGFKKSTSGFLTFIPNWDGDFFPKPLDELRKDASKKPMMTGVAEYEGLMLGMMNPAFHPSDTGLQLTAQGTYGPDFAQNPEEAQKAFYEFYTNGVDKTDENAMKKKLVEAVGDEFFNVGVLMAAKNAAKHGNDVYFYTFDYVNPDGFGPFAGIIPFAAATHCTELRYLLGEGVYSKFEPNEDDLKVMDKTITLFSNFAKYGNPNGNGPIEWEKYDLNTPEKHYRIALPKCEMRNVFQNGRIPFLEKLDGESLKYQQIVFGNKKGSSKM